MLSALWDPSLWCQPQKQPVFSPNQPQSTWQLLAKPWSNLSALIEHGQPWLAFLNVLGISASRVVAAFAQPSSLSVHHAMQVHRLVAR